MNQILIELRNEMTRCARSGCNDRFKELYASNFELQRIKKWLHIASGGGNLELVGSTAIEDKLQEGVRKLYLI